MWSMWVAIFAALSCLTVVGDEAPKPKKEVKQEVKQIGPMADFMRKRLTDACLKDHTKKYNVLLLVYDKHPRDNWKYEEVGDVAVKEAGLEGKGFEERWPVQQKAAINAFRRDNFKLFEAIDYAVAQGICDKLEDDSYIPVLGMVDVTARPSFFLLLADFKVEDYHLQSFVPNTALYIID